MKFPLFVLVGDPFLCEEKRKEILGTLEKELGRGLHLVVRRPGDIPMAEVFSEARTLPFLAAAQLFCFREADQFTKDDIAFWAEYFQSPPPRTFLIFEAEALDRNHPFLEWAGKAGQAFFLESQANRMVAQFIRGKLNQARKMITREALENLERRLGESLTFLDSFLEQLILFVGERPQIESSDVDAFDEKLSQMEGDDLLQALSDRDVSKALEALNDLLDAGFRDFPSVLGLIHWQLRRLWEAKRWQARGTSERDISYRLRLSPSRAQSFFKRLERFSLEELEGILEGLFELDWRLKTGRAEGRYEIETWLAHSISDGPA